jgi:hypothetical protein
MACYGGTFIFYFTYKQLTELLLLLLLLYIVHFCVVLTLYLAAGC